MELAYFAGLYYCRWQLGYAFADTYLEESERVGSSLIFANGGEFRDCIKICTFYFRYFWGILRTFHQKEPPRILSIYISLLRLYKIRTMYDCPYFILVLRGVNSGFFRRYWKFIGFAIKNLQGILKFVTNIQYFAMWWYGDNHF